MKGRVCLIGAGCGSADLITLRGYRRLMRADVVVYDDLLEKDLLEVLPPTVKTIYVGKRSGRHSAAQEEINRLLVQLAEQGNDVCRLKGGDPFVFGRGGEEIAALNRAGIPWEIVPGISSCIAVPELAGIPVTHRGISRSFHVITAHTARAQEDLPQRMEQLAKLEGTLIFLMGLERLELICQGLISEGKSPHTPAAVIGDRCVRGTLEDIAEKSSSVQPPAIILVGGTAALELLPQTPLSGLTIGLTGTAALRERLQLPLRRLGASVCCLQRSTPKPACSPQQLLRQLLWLQRGQEQWVVFTSPRAVEHFFRLLRLSSYDTRRLSPVCFAAMGSGTASRLEQYGIFADAVPQLQNAAALGQLLAACCTTRSSVLLLHGDCHDPTPENVLTQRGIPHHSQLLYTLQSGEADPVQTDYVLFGSPRGVEAFFQKGGSIPKYGAVCIGRHTARCAAKWCPHIIRAADTAVDPILKALINDIKEQKCHESLL